MTQSHKSLGRWINRASILILISLPASLLASVPSASSPNEKPETQKKSAVEKGLIAGQCVVYSSPKDSQGSPGIGIRVVLTDLQENEIKSIHTFVDGKFQFTVPKGKKFRLKIDSTYFKIKGGFTKILEAGDQVKIPLQPISSHAQK